MLKNPTQLQHSLNVLGQRIAQVTDIATPMRHDDVEELIIALALLNRAVAVTRPLDSDAQRALAVRCLSLRLQE
jgi:hypothetical protein